MGIFGTTQDEADQKALEAEMAQQEAERKKAEAKAAVDERDRVNRENARKIAEDKKKAGISTGIFGS